MNAVEPKPSHLFYQSRLRRPMVDRAEGIYLWDVHGRRVIDGSSGAMVVNIGHSNRNVLDAMKRQMDRVTFAYRLHFENEPAEELARQVAARMPGDLDRVFFVSGGSEAVESCLKLARQWAVATGQDSRWKVISRFPAYHGSTLGALAVTGYAALTDPFTPMMRVMPKIAAPTAYLDRDNLSMEERGLKYADLLEEKIQEEGPDSVLAFIMEPVGGASTGALVAPDSYYPRIREICDRYGILLIHDEVMGGAGRTGKFLAGDHWGCRPDLVSMSKGFGAGYVPLGAMVAPMRLVKPVLDAGGFQHGFTYAGNPLACAAGLAVLKVIDEEDILARATVLGEKLVARLKSFQTKNDLPPIADVRGLGAMVAFDLVKAGGAPDPDAAKRLIEAARANGLILLGCGLYANSIRILVPLTVGDATLEEGLAALEKSLREAGAPSGG